MKWPKRIYDEDIGPCMNEWKLAGYSVYVHHDYYLEVVHSVLVYSPAHEKPLFPKDILMARYVRSHADRTLWGLTLHRESPTDRVR